MQPKFISIVGAGGKTTALRTLARAFAAHRVLVTTSTHIFPLSPPDCRLTLTDPSADALLAALAQPGVVCAGARADGGKLGALPAALLSQAAQAADLVLCEADGAHRLPLKLHRPDEPAIPPETDLCLIIAGLSALGRLVHQTVHRYALQPDWAADPNHPVGVDELLYCVRETAAACGLPPDRLRILLNQADTPALAAQADPVVRALRADGLDCRICSLHAGFPLAAWLCGSCIF